MLVASVHLALPPQCFCGQCFNRWCTNSDTFLIFAGILAFGLCCHSSLMPTHSQARVKHTCCWCNSGIVRRLLHYSLFVVSFWSKANYSRFVLALKSTYKGHSLRALDEDCAVDIRFYFPFGGGGSSLTTSNCLQEEWKFSIITPPLTLIEWIGCFKKSMIFRWKASCMCGLKLNPGLSSSVEIYHMNISWKGFFRFKRSSLLYSLIPPKCSSNNYFKNMYFFSLFFFVFPVFLHWITVASWQKHNDY